MVAIRTRNGTAKTNANGKAEVAFPMARGDSNYSISLSSKKEGAPVILSYSAKAVDGFKVWAFDVSGNPVNNCDVDWLIMPEVT